MRSKSQFLAETASYMCICFLAIAAPTAVAVSCTSPVRTATLAPHSTPYCFRVSVAFAGRAQAGHVCAETQALCEKASGLAVQLGGLSGVRAVGACRGEP